MQTPGPVGLVFKAVAALGWTWTSVGVFKRPGRCDLPLCGGPDAWWDHELRDGLRLARWAETAKKRNDMQGLDAVQGVDRLASLALLSRSTGARLGLLRAIVVGSLRLQKRLFEASLVNSPISPFCGTADETLRHCFWDCDRWSAIRARHCMSNCTSLASWPACTLECGLFIDDQRVPALTQQLLDEEHILANFQSYFDLPATRHAIAVNEPMNMQVLWTDGASAHNQDSRFRRAGSGIWYGIEHALNWSGMLPGLAQSNQRAELFAVVVACVRDPRPLDIRSDSEWVCKGFHDWRTWASVGWRGEHADLWDLLAKELCDRAGDVTVSWVKGHATEKDIKRGRTTYEDKAGNDGADKLAVAGAATHQVPAEVVEDARSRRQMARQTQEMMVDILIERQKQENLFAEEQPDRGSDMGEGGLDFDDCMELLESDMDECMEFGVLDLHDTEIPSAFDDNVVQVDMPEDTPYVEGAPDNMHVHVVQMNSLDDGFDDGFV